MRAWLGTRRLVLTATALLAVLSFSASGSQGAQRLHTRPNVLVIMTDDETVENVRVMTNVRRLLAAQGTTFDNFVTSFPLCCPSRATFLTGQYSHNDHVVGNSIVNGLANLNQQETLPVWLRRAGYSTLFVGKYLNEYRNLGLRKTPPGWDDWNVTLTFGYYNYALVRNGKAFRYGSKPEDYQTDVLTRIALDVLDRHAGSSKPFFMWLSYFAPHVGGPTEPGDPIGLQTPAVAPRDRGAFANEPLPMPASFNEADISDKPAAIRNLPSLSPEEIEAITSSYRQRLESLLAVDDGIGLVLAKLRSLGELDNTLILFTSDNGWFQGEHRIADGKVLLYEPSIRVPLIVRGPGVPKNAHLEQPTANVDLAPTILAAAHAKPGLPQDGRSLLPLFADPGLEWGRDILLERGPGASGTGPPLYSAIRTPRYVYAEYTTGERELYDLRADPDELQSLHADPAEGPLMAELSARLARLRTCAGAACSVGADLRLEPVTGQNGCAQAVTLTGADASHVVAADVVVNGRYVQRVTPPALEAPVPPLRTAAHVRVRAILDDGREQTVDGSFTSCA
jgi:arylsulfatase A-like enzyme